MKEIWNQMKKNAQLCLSDLDKSCTRTNRELVYGAAACVAVGVVLGMLFSPKKTVTIGCNNVNNESDSPASSSDEQDEDKDKE